MRGLAKGLVSGVAWLLAAPIGYPIRWLAALDARDQLFRMGSQAVSLIPGLFGNYVRRSYYAIVLDEVGDRLTVEFGTIFSRRCTRIGRDVYIGANCTIGLCDILDDVLIGSGVDVISGKRIHHFDRTDVPIRLQGGELKRISIGPDAWLGNKAVVMADVGRGCVIGAAATVTAPCEAMGVYAGNPAGRIRDRRGRSPRGDQPDRHGGSISS